MVVEWIDWEKKRIKNKHKRKKAFKKIRQSEKDTREKALSDLIKALEEGKYDSTPTEFKHGSEHLFKVNPDGTVEPL